MDETTTTSPLGPDAAAPRAAAPTPLRMRAIAPDLARGLMLLFIAVANAPSYLWGDENGMIGSHAADGSAADLVAQTVAIIAIDGRSYPMFAFLFGYGIVQLYRRQQEAGVSHADARRLLRKRHWWMVAFGFVHAALLWHGDILGAYGLAGLLLSWWFLDRRDRTVRVWALVLTGLLLAAVLLAGVGGALLSGMSVDEGAPDETLALPDPTAQPDYVLSALERVGFWAILTPGTAVVGLVVPIAILVAFVAARHRVLESPAQHLRLLRVSAVVGIAIGWGTGALLAMQNLRVWDVPGSFDALLLAGHLAGGLFGGLGYVAVFGLLAARLQSRGRGAGRVASALQAVGRRSLSSYLTQSVLLAPLLSAWGFGLGGHLSSWSVAIVAVGVWVATVIVAVLLERADRRGPAEELLRRLAYPRPGRG